VTNTDLDTAGITVSAISGNTTEAGGTATFTVVLTSEPTADVTIGLSSDDIGEGAVPASVTVAPGDWNSPQSVTVTGVDDDVIDGDQAYTIITAAATSTDPNYNGIDPADVSVTNNDDDTAISVRKTVDLINPNVDDEVVFTITVTNSGPKDATGVQVIDILPSGLSYESDDSGGSYDLDTGIWNIGNLSATAPNNTVSLNITAKATHEGEILNIASIIAYPDNSRNSSGVMLNRGTQADLGIWKTVDNPNPKAGDTITFTITVRNNGLDNATGVVVTDLLPDGLTYVNDDSGGSYDSETGVWDIGNLNVGASATLQLTVTADNEEEKINTARIILSDQIDPDTTSNESGAVINQSGPLSDLAIQKTVNQSVIDVGEEVVFTVVVRNNGPDDATDVEVTDVLSAGLSYVNDSSGGSYDPGTGAWAVGDLGAYATLDITATVDQPGDITNTATRTTSSPTDMNDSNDSDEATVTGLAADILVEKAVDKEEPRVGDNIVFTITVTNNGPDDATGVEVTDLLRGLCYP